MADGFDDKMKLKRTLAWKKLRGNSVVCCLVPVLCMAVLWICFNLEANLPAMPVVWKFCSSQLFLFMVINVIVIVLVVMSGSLRPSNGQEDLYDEFVRRNQAARKSYAPRAVANDETVANSEAEKPQAEGIAVSRRSAANSEAEKQQAEAIEVSSCSAANSEVEKQQAEAIEVSGRSVPKKLETAKSFSGTKKRRGRKLRRSESADIEQIRENYEEVAVSNSLIVLEVPSNEEDMPDEELQRRSDEFIRIQRERFLAK